MANPAILAWPHNASAITLVDPASLSGRLWNASDSALGADGTTVSSWAGGVLVQADAAKQPVVATLDSVKCASFDGTDVLVHAGTYYLSSDQTMFAVVRPGASTGDKIAIGMSAGTGIILSMNALKPKISAYGGDWAAATSATAATLNTWCVISGRYVRSSSLSVRLNVDIPVTASTTTASTPDRRNQLGGNAAAVSWVGGIAEAWNFSRAFTDAEWVGVIAYLKDKYGIA